MCLTAVLPVVSTTPAQPSTTGELISSTLVIIISRQIYIGHKVTLTTRLNMKCLC